MQGGIGMRIFIVSIAFLIGVNSSFGQPPQAPPVKTTPQAPAVKSDDLDYPYTYYEGQKQAKEQDKRLVVFVNVQPRHINGLDYVPSFAKTLEGYPAKCIVVTYPGGQQWKATFTTETDAEIVAAMSERKVSRAAVPFQQQNAQREEPEDGASSAPWYTKEEHDNVKKRWPKGVLFPAGLRFYSMRPLYQKMYTMNNGNSRFADPTTIHDAEGPEHHPFIVSGGMAGITGWHSTKGLAIPTGSKILAWKENTDVRAFSLVPRWRWRFPEGTVAVDALSNSKGEFFEIRTQTREEDGWSTKVIYKDLENAPTGYTGLEQSCSSCHSRTGEIVSVPGRIYLRERWGSDGRFSFRVYDDSGNLFRNVPIDVR